MPKLIINGTMHELVEDVITIGRGADNTVVINDPSVSAHHAQLQLAGETYWLKDLGSTNGTHVNGKPVTETLLRFDDRIRFGAAEAVYESDATGSKPLPKPEEIEARPALVSVAPADFAKAAAPRGGPQARDPLRAGIFVALVMALLAFIGSLIAAWLMRAPGL
ncbi:MAG: FHA domain-containing protein [Chthoniobacterales bacterium]|nr:FHA domain-containing protein [Chthoniobacterales bacterium]